MNRLPQSAGKKRVLEGWGLGQTNRATSGPLIWRANKLAHAMERGALGFLPPAAIVAGVDGSSLSRLCEPSCPTVGTASSLGGEQATPSELRDNSLLQAG